MRLERTDPDLEVLWSRIRSGELDLQPDFQRGEVWDSTRRRRLVDTILRQWYIPAIHVVHDDESGTDSVLDGQQRLAAIRDFFSGHLTIDGSAAPYDPEIAALNGAGYLDLPDAVQRRIRRFSLTCITLYDYSPEEPYELFFRLNQHYALTPSEKRNALYGEAREQVKRLLVSLEETGLLNRDSIGFTNDRLGYDDVLARVCLAIENGSLSEPITNSRIETFYRDGRFSDQTLDQAYVAFRSLLQSLVQIQTRRVKFNKATLFSWIIFSHRQLIQTGTPPNPEVIEVFELERAEVRRHSGSGEQSLLSREGWIQALLQTYNDRASYRVADTLSVLLRDLILNTFAFAFAGEGANYEATSRLVEELGNSRPSYAEGICVEFINRGRWDHRL